MILISLTEKDNLAAARLAMSNLYLNGCSLPWQQALQSASQSPLP